MKINTERLIANLNALAKIGATAGDGVSRMAMTGADIAGRAWFQGKIEKAGLAYKIDGAANQYAVLDMGAEESILIGSHLDTVPNGGRYDGALGVLAAFEVVQTLKESGEKRPVNVEVVNFTDEEGSVYGMIGSRAVTGTLRGENLTGLANQPDFDAGMARLGITPDSILSAARDNIRAFVEVHIEQGKRLEAQHINIGIVPSIVGIRMFRLHFYGEAAHAGTMPMTERRDALWGATDFAWEARKAVIEKYLPGVVNIGKVHIPNSAGNIVPAQVTISLEFRNGEEATLDKMEAELLQLAEAAAVNHDLQLTAEHIGNIPAAEMDKTVVGAIGAACDELGLSHTPMFSFAGHDSQTMARKFPTAMFFVPSANGISHNPKEYTTPEDVENAANVLLHTVLGLAR
jgi:N-carbamoyl-L-amino-acid hydrolase